MMSLVYYSHSSACQLGSECVPGAERGEPWAWEPAGGKRTAEGRGREDDARAQVRRRTSGDEDAMILYRTEVRRPTAEGA